MEYNNFGELKIEIPEGWHEVSVGQYQRIQEINSIEYKSTFEKYIELISCLTKLDREVLWETDVEDINKLGLTLEWLSEIKSNDEIDFLEIDGKKYKFKKDYNSLSVGEMITLEQLNDGNNSDYVQGLHLVLGVLMREVIDGKEQKFNANIVLERANMFKDKMMISDCFFLFSNLRNTETGSTTIIEDYSPEVEAQTVKHHQV